jgi:hypothetical protein
MIWGIFLASKIWILLGLKGRTYSPGSRLERTTTRRWMDKQYSLKETTELDLLRVFLLRDNLVLVSPLSLL